MAAKLEFSSRGDQVAVVCCSKLKIFDTSDGTVKFEAKFCESEAAQTSATPSLVTAFSTKGELFAACPDNKEVILWDANKWEIISKRSTNKRVTAMKFNSDDQTLVVADKAGDGYSFSVVNPEEEGKLILGHLSMILDLEVSPDSKVVITADRDEKIRVSCFPNSYNIISFCLGHTDFVSQVTTVPKLPGHLVSGSGDGTLKCWKYSEGTEIQVHHFSKKAKKSQEQDTDKEPSIVSCISASTKDNLICVLREGVSSVGVFELRENKLSELQEITTDVPPWHATFDTEGRLWVLQAHVDEPAVVFEISMQQFQRSCSHSSVLMKALSDWKYLEEATDKAISLTMLRKKEYDGATGYFDKKEERLKRKPQNDENKLEDSKKTKATDV